MKIILYIALFLINLHYIKKIDNIYVLKKLEYEYNNFLEKKCHILLMLNMVEEVFEIRDSLIMRINTLEREYRNRKLRS